MRRTSGCLGLLAFGFLFHPGTRGACLLLFIRCELARPGSAILAASTRSGVIGTLAEVWVGAFGAVEALRLVTVAADFAVAARVYVQHPLLISLLSEHAARRKSGTA